MNDYFIYNHGGSANHGCEALVRTAVKLFGGQERMPVLSESPQQDLRYGLDEIAEILPATTAYSRMSPAFLRAYLALRRKNDYFQMDVLPYRRPIQELGAQHVELSVGGDIYCYEDYRKFILLHEMIAARGCKSVLLGCSLEEKLFEDPAFVQDMRRYSYISARESLTYEMLKKAGLEHIGLTPDAAFTLEADMQPLPQGFAEGNTVGVNLSPLVVRREAQPGIAVESFVRLIRGILDRTDMSVALIPHVVWRDNDDRTVLREIYDRVNCPERVVMIEDCGCAQLKGYIARCRFFVGARTHATIAAYSSGVPTLVLGYSTKSRGIARDLFGTDEHYVLPIGDLDREDAMTQAFDWLIAHEQEIRGRLAQVMPAYIRRAGEIREKVEEALER